MVGRHRLEKWKNIFRGRKSEDEPSTVTLPVRNPTPPSISKPITDPEQPPVDEQPQHKAERNELQEKLWNEAYDTLHKGGNKYIVEYEEILLTELKNDNPDIASLGTSYEERWRNMQRLVELGLKKTETEAKIYGKVNDGLQLFDTVRSLVTPAVSAVPQAAIPWVGVCFILEVFSNPAKQPGVHRAGLQHVLSRVNWYWNLTELLLQDNLKAKEDIRITALSNLRQDLRSYVLDLYQKFLSYLIESICYFHKNRATAFLKSVVYIDYWGGKLTDIEASEAEFERMSQKYNTTESRERLGTLVIGVKNIEKAIDRQTQQLQKLNEDESDKICFQDLYTTNPFMDKTQIEYDKGTPLPHCYSWIFLTEGFQNWQQDPDQRLLWIKGDPGKGKTMLLCGIIDRLDEMTPNLISCFFCQATENYQNDATAVLRGLIWSLACQHPDLITHVRTQFDNSGRKAFDGPNKWEVLSGILKKMVSDRDNHVPEGTTIVIDALDECIKDNDKLLDLIVDICADKDSRIKWIVSSRNWVEIEDTIMDESISPRRLILSLEDNEEVEQSIKKAVDAFIKHKVEELKKKKKHAEIPPEVNEIFTEKTGNTFLWVALACKRLESKDVEPWQILDILKGLPSGLKDLYRRMIQEVMNSSHASQCRDILAAATLAHRPMSLAELSSSSKSLSQHSNRLDALKRQVLRCKGFLVVSDDVVSFVHQSAKDFLLEDQLAKEFVWEAESEDQLSKSILHNHHNILLTMLETMKKTLKYDIYDLKKPSAEVPIPDEEDAFDPLDPVEYACCYWADHILTFDDESAAATLDFLKASLLYWLEACSLVGEVVTTVLAIQKLQKLLIGTEYHELVSVLQDANRFVLSFKTAIELFPLQIYTSGLLFSPKSSIARQAFQQHTFETSWLDLPVPEDWDACVQTLEGHTSTVLNLAFSGNGQWLASASEDSTLRIWDVATGVCLQTMEYPYEDVQAAAFSPDSTCLALSTGHEIHFCDTKSNEFSTVRTVSVLGTPTIGLLFSPDGNWLACWSTRGKVRILDAKTGDCIYDFTLEQGRAPPIKQQNRFSFSSNSQRILVGSGKVAIRDIVKGSWITEDQISPGRLLTSAFSSDGTWVGHAYGEHGHSIWRISDSGVELKFEILREDGLGLPALGQYVIPLPSWNRPSAFSGDGKQVATCTQYPYRIAIIEASTGDTSFADARDSADAALGLPKAMAWSNDSQWLAVGGVEGNGEITIWDSKAIKNGSKENQIRKRIRTMALSTDGQRFATGSEDGVVEIQDMARPGNNVLTLKGHDSIIHGIVFSPSGDMLATQCSYHVKIWNIKVAGECVHTFKVGPIDIQMISVSFWPMAFSADDYQFAFTKGEEIVELHDLTNQSMSELQMENVSCLVFSPDGLSLAAGDQVGKIRICDLQTKDIQEHKSGSHQSSHAIAYSSNGKLLAYATTTGEIYVWEMPAAKGIFKLQTGLQIAQLLFSPDGRSLMTERGRLTPESWPSSTGVQDAETETNELAVVPFAAQGYGVGFDGAWLTKDGERLVWLPPHYRSSSDFQKHVLVSDSAVAIRSSSDQLLMFGFENGWN
ncbi:Vegetative incompatibility protein HET-E-1 [Fusarium venenatum]|uniref:NACHT domain-containing protein n=1 Tax=Fusarium venenatum TaxID=56646 RepID=A0A2L2U149_9HYPO|nr:uncharacterized protein FVRRES_04207 [Fusarium venenatum]KAG8352391.1 Vegetative incompatibility protein HET-E-1 [Fusarium venenatum]KAH7002838.1 quinon protein alcohol dehydrogenase-like superfamily [Fusarium venenatum]CEI67695.1 unnamed protein product [Fusarium venenatum]